jgi:hypothetical protein
MISRTMNFFGILRIEKSRRRKGCSLHAESNFSIYPKPEGGATTLTFNRLHPHLQINSVRHPGNGVRFRPARHNSGRAKTRAEKLENAEKTNLFLTSKAVFRGNSEDGRVVAGKLDCRISD